SIICFLYTAATSTSTFTLSLHDALPIFEQGMAYISGYKPKGNYQQLLADVVLDQVEQDPALDRLVLQAVERAAVVPDLDALRGIDRKSTRLNSSHVKISYAVFCLKKKNT